MESLEIYPPHLPLLQQKVVATLLTCKQSRGVLIVFLITTICIRVRKL